MHFLRAVSYTMVAHSSSLCDAELSLESDNEVGNERLRTKRVAAASMFAAASVAKFASQYLVTTALL